MVSPYSISLRAEVQQTNFQPLKVSNQPFAQKPGPDAVQALSGKVQDKFEFTSTKSNSRELQEQTRRMKTVFETEK